LTLHGANLGVSTLTLDRVSWGPTGSEFVAQNCIVVAPHASVRCITAEGVGRGLRIDVVVDQVESAAPRTKYRAPSISSISSPIRPNGFSTRGGEDFVIVGSDFGNATLPSHRGRSLQSIAASAISSIMVNSSTDPLGLLGTGLDASMESLSLEDLAQRSTSAGGDGISYSYLDSVSYGPYLMPASGCNITKAHEEITCRTLSGVGLQHGASISVAGQDSGSDSGASESLSISFAPPRLLALQLRPQSVASVPVPPNSAANFSYDPSMIPTSGGVLRVVGQDLGLAVNGLTISAAVSASNKELVQRQFSEVLCDASTSIDAQMFARTFTDFYDPLPHAASFSKWHLDVQNAGGTVGSVGSVSGTPLNAPIVSASEDADLYCLDIIIPPADGRSRAIKVAVGS